jgi:hemerythrin-like metal-binding protein
MIRDFVWDPSKLALNVAEMDAEHLQLIDLMNRLQKLYTGGAPAGVQGKAFAALAEYTVKHFRDEEAYMQRIGYPGLAVHQGVHRHLLTKINQYAISFKETGAFTDELFAFLHMWLRSHICGIDMQYANHVHGGQKVSA